MNISIFKDSNNYLVQLKGEIDESNAYELRNALDNIIDFNNSICITLDFTNLEFLDSTAIGVILGRYKKCKHKDIYLYIKNPSSHIDLILKTCGIYSIIKKVC